MKTFLNSNYRDVIKNELEAKKSLGIKISYQGIAEQIRIPKSYLSRVMNHDANLSSDQLYGICEILGLDQDETDFLLLLLEWERSTNKKRKKEIDNKIKAIRERRLTSKDNLEIAEFIQESENFLEYYLDPWHQIVHMALLIPEISRVPSHAAEFLGLDLRRFAAIVKNLERMGIIKQSGTKIIVVKNDMHLSPESSVYFSWRSHLRQLSANRLSALPVDKSYSFSAIFTADEESVRQIKSEYLIFLKKIQKIVKQAPSENAYQINFDLFPWTDFNS